MAPSSANARSGPAGAGTAGAEQSERRGVLRGSGDEASGRRKLKAVAAVLDRRPLLSPAMLRVTRWMADYYLCPWGQVLEAVVPAGVRHDAGGRDVTFFTASPNAAERIDQLKLPAKQAEALRLLAASERR